MIPLYSADVQSVVYYIGQTQRVLFSLNYLLIIINDVSFYYTVFLLVTVIGG